MNVASFLGDVAHVASILLILGSIVYRKSCKGISGKMQVLYAIVFPIRYLDLLDFLSYYNTSMKLFFILSSYLIVFLMYVVYKKTYEREYDKFWIEIPLVLCLGLGMLEAYDINETQEVLYSFSRYLEAVLFIPQFYFTYKKGIKSNIITYYVLALILYRGFYIANWFIRYTLENHFDVYIVIPGIVQFVIYFPYFFLPNEKSADTLPVTVVQQPANDASPIAKKRPHIERQESLLETPFLKRNAASYTSVYTIGLENRDSSLNGSQTSLNITSKPEEKY